MSKKYDLLTLGELLLRLSPQANERMSRTKIFEQNIGGAEFNVAAGAAQLGLKTGLVGKIPAHAIGQLARNEVHFQNVSDEYPISVVAATQRIVHSPKRHSFGSVIYDAKKQTFVEEEMIKTHQEGDDGLEMKR